MKNLISFIAVVSLVLVQSNFSWGQDVESSLNLTPSTTLTLPEAGANAVTDTKVKAEVAAPIDPAIGAIISALAPLSATTCKEAVALGTELKASATSCYERNKLAGTVCIESFSPALQGALVIILPLIKQISGSSVKDACDKHADITDIAKNALLAYQMACGAAKTACSMSCKAAIASPEKILATLNECLIRAVMDKPIIATAIQGVTAASTSFKGPETPGSTGNRLKVCTKDFEGMLIAGGIGALKMWAESKTATACADKTAATKSPDECAKITDPAAQKACYDTACAQPQYAASLVCQKIICSDNSKKFTPACATLTCSLDNYRFQDECLKYTCSSSAYASSAACVKCQTQPELCGRATAGASFGGGAGSSGGITSAGINKMAPKGSSSGGDAGPSFGGSDNTFSPGPGGGGSSQAGPPVGGGGGGGLSGGSGVGGGSSSDGGGANQKRLSASIYSGEGGGGGGGFGGYRGSSDTSGLRRYMPGGSKDPSAVGVAGLGAGASKEISGAFGKSLWEKVKERYKDNKSTLKND